MTTSSWQPLSWQSHHWEKQPFFGVIVWLGGVSWYIYPWVLLVNFLPVLGHFLSLFPDNSCHSVLETKLHFTPPLLCRASSDHWLPESGTEGREHMRPVNVLCFYLLMDNLHSAFMACSRLNSLKYELWGVILYCYDIRFPPSTAGSVYSEISGGFCFLS